MRWLVGAFVGLAVAMSGLSRAQSADPNACNTGEFLGWGVVCKCTKHDLKTVLKYTDRLLFPSYSAADIAELKGCLKLGERTATGYDNYDQVCGKVCSRSKFFKDFDNYVDLRLGVDTSN